eukprot:TRINITY_DN7801_c0_g1_i1.p1 TRINITY_DN7801_c0_g1~~TRINITY_DN7801_c0_g1_i1.p1  ORF type:complete len:228 (+),score=27.31 TRINITY_DN7801_c0_g1_i1:110-793(+)
MGRVGNYEKAKQCFEYLVRVNSTNSEAYCGASICSIHLKDMDSGLRYAKLAIENAGKWDKSIGLYNYLAALCSNALLNLKDAIRYYGDFKATIAGLNKNQVVHFTFGLLLSSIIKDKDLAAACANSYEILNEKFRPEYKEPINNSTGIKQYCNKNGERIALKTSKIVAILKSLQFFCRFSDSYLIKIVACCVFKNLPSNYLFLLNKDEVAVIPVSYTHLTLPTNREV